MIKIDKREPAKIVKYSEEVWGESNNGVIKLNGKIKIDIRESDFIFRGFDKEKIEYERETLPIGDFQYGNTIIEHKTVEDFIQSFVSGHLQKQIIQQEENFENSYLIISGDFDRIFFNPHLRGHCSREKITGMLASVLVRFKKTKILQTIYLARACKIDENRMIAIMVQKLLEKSNDGKEITIKDTELLKSKLSDEDFRIRLLCSFSNVGRKRAEEFLQNENVCNAINNFLTCLETCGIKKMENIVKKHKGEGKKSITIEDVERGVS